MKYTITIEGAEKARRLLDPKIVQNAARRTVNKVVKTAKTEMSAQVRKKFAIQKNELDPTMTVKLAKGRELESILTVRSRPVSLVRFKLKQIRGGVQTFATKNKGGLRGIAQKRIKRGKYSGVQVKIKTEGRNLVLPHAFIARGKGGVPVVFSRVPNKGKLRARRVISIASMAKQPETLQPVIEKVRRKQNDVFNQELKYEMLKRRGIK